MIILAVITAIFVIISFFMDRNKTIAAFKVAIERFIKILMPLFIVLVLVSAGSYFIPDKKMVSNILGGSNLYINTLIASLIGSISLMPGFIAFPLGGLLRANSVQFMVISAFTTTLMMVGFLTFPIEQTYFGTKVAVIRNLISFGIAITVALATGIIFGEMFV